MAMNGWSVERCLFLAALCLLLLCLVMVRRKDSSSSDYGLLRIREGFSSSKRPEPTEERDGLPMVDLGEDHVLIFPFPKSRRIGWYATTLCFSEMVHVDVASVSVQWRDEAMVLLDTLLPVMKALRSPDRVTTRITHIIVDEVKNQNPNPNPEQLSEKFELDITAGEVDGEAVARITVNGISGLHPALASLVQLGTSPTKVGLPLWIADEPDVPWRGLMVDVARHFVPMEQLLRVLDGMWLARLNVLHLHITDAQSFTLRLPDVHIDGIEVPLSHLAEKGAHAPDQTYNAEDMRKLVQHATARGIRVVPEIDVPAHAAAWGKAFPDIVVDCTATAERLGMRVPLDAWVLDPTSPRAVMVAAQVIAQVALMFPDAYLHVGGDEVVLECWDENSGVMKRAADQNRSGGTEGRGGGNVTALQLLQSFEKAVFQSVRAAGKVPVVWQGVLDQGAIPSGLEKTDATAAVAVADMPMPGSSAGKTIPNTVVEPWKCWSRLSTAAARHSYSLGLDVVNAACLYLDWSHTDIASYMAASPIDDAAATAVSNTSGQNYNHRPHLLGGEVVMFTENADVTNLECRLWPRAGAAAAALWHGTSGAARAAALNGSVTTATLAAYVHFRRVLHGMGVSAAPVTLHIRQEDAASLSPALTAPQDNERDETALLEFLVSRGNGTTATGALATPKGEPNLLALLQATAQCPVIPTDMQRPMESWRVKGPASFTAVAQLNVADGAAGAREKLMRAWLRNKAAAGVALVGLCEMNGWQQLPPANEDTIPFSPPLPATKNFPKMRGLSEDTGFPYWHIFATHEHPYNIGVLSTDEFVVKGEYGPQSTPPLQRGLLWVYVPRRRLHVMILHLHAHSASQRTIEAEFVATLVAPLARANEKVIVMGDLNTLSSLDRNAHEQAQLPQLLASHHPTWRRLRKKFCLETGVESREETGECSINYAPMDKLLAAGLYDSCLLACTNGGSNSSRSSMWSPRGSDALSQCMKANCPQSEPTKFDPEWPPALGPAPPIRLDFVLMSDALASTATGLTSVVERTNVTDVLSDHYPAVVRWQNE